MAKEIRMKHKGIQKLVGALNMEGTKVSRVHAANILKGIVDSDLSEKVRQKAIEMGGVIVEN